MTIFHFISNNNKCSRYLKKFNSIQSHRTTQMESLVGSKPLSITSPTVAAAILCQKIHYPITSWRHKSGTLTLFSILVDNGVTNQSQNILILSTPQISEQLSLAQVNSGYGPNRKEIVLFWNNDQIFYIIFLL